MSFTPGPHRTRDGTAATVTGVTDGSHPVQGYVGNARHKWTKFGQLLPGGLHPLDLLYRDEPDEEADQL